MSDDEDEEKRDETSGNKERNGGYQPAFEESYVEEYPHPHDVPPEEPKKGALAVVLEKYDPEEFNEFVDGLIESYQEAQQTGYEYRKSIQTRAIAVVLTLFIGLIILTTYTDLSGESVVFFAGIIVGYIMSLANSLSG